MRALVFGGVIALLSVIGGRAMAFGNCLDAGYLAYFRAGLAPQPCEEEYVTTVRAASGTATLRVIRLSSSIRSPGEDWLPEVDALAAGVGGALDALGAGRLPREITVLLTDTTDRTELLEEVHADTTRIPGGECRVAFYKLAGGASLAEFTFTLAMKSFTASSSKPGSAPPGWKRQAGGSRAVRSISPILPRRVRAGRTGSTPSTPIPAASA